MPTNSLTAFIARQSNESVIIKVAGSIWASYPGTLPTSDLAHWVNGWCHQFGLNYIVKTHSDGNYGGERRILAILKKV